MSFVGLSLRSSRVIGLRPTQILSHCSRTLQVSCSRFDNDSGKNENEAKDKLAQLLKDIREAKAKTATTETVAGEFRPN